MASRALVWHEIQRIREAVIVVHYTVPELMPYISIITYMPGGHLSGLAEINDFVLLIYKEL